MKDNCEEIVYKDVVIIGNGPSGLALSYILSGNLPYVVSHSHPDELLSARLATVTNRSLVYQDLGYLAAGLEGRSTNPVSLLLDSLTNPYADIGLEMDSLVEWRKEGMEIEHIVLGKGPPGGSWHTMDPEILTLSLGSWMALPGLPYKARDGAEKRASAGNVARYYVEYARAMNLEKNMLSGVTATDIRPIDSEGENSTTTPPTSLDRLFGECCQHSNNAQRRENLRSNSSSWVSRVNNDNAERKAPCLTPESSSAKDKSCPLASAFNFIRLRSGRSKCKTMRCFKRRRNILQGNELSPDRKIREIARSDAFNFDLTDLKNDRLSADVPNTKARSISFSCDYDDFRTSCDNIYSKSFNDQGSDGCFGAIGNAHSYDFGTTPAFASKNRPEEVFRIKQHDCDSYENRAYNYHWLVETYDTVTGKRVTYTCKDLVLANGANDLPNQLAVEDKNASPTWLLHDLRSLEDELDRYLRQRSGEPDPVLIVGAGLSAADAVIATRGRNVPVLHVFRNKSSNFSKKLPENMYPEYHKVHQMMQDGGSSYPLYKALPECSLTDFNPTSRTVTLSSSTGEETKHQVSFAVVLIGSRPDLSFLHQDFRRIGVNKTAPIDCKMNTIDINKLTHGVSGSEHLYAMGPLVGDNFVRFISGGALAVVSDLYKKYGY